MQHRTDDLAPDHDDSLTALRARLERARQGADRAMAGQPPGPDAEAMRQVYANHIAWLEDRICEMEGLKGDE